MCGYIYINTKWVKIEKWEKVYKLNTMKEIRFSQSLSNKTEVFVEIICNVQKSHFNHNCEWV